MFSQDLKPIPDFVLKNETYYNSGFQSVRPGWQILRTSIQRIKDSI